MQKTNQVELYLEPSTKISTIREQAAKTFGIDKSRFRLKAPDISSLRDECTVAYYNFLNGTVIELANKKK